MALRTNQNPTVTDTASQAGTAVTLSGTSATVAAANPDRIQIIICNDHATQIVYLKLGTAAAEVNKGIRINAAGGSVTLSAYTGAITGIATGATTGVTVTEI